MRLSSNPYRISMESKTARLTVLIDPDKKKALEQLCARQDITPSQVVRQLIRDYLADHDVVYTPSGAKDGDTSENTAGTVTQNPVVKARKRGH